MSEGPKVLEARITDGSTLLSEPSRTCSALQVLGGARSTTRLKPGLRWLDPEFIRASVVFLPGKILLGLRAANGAHCFLHWVARP